MNTIFTRLNHTLTRIDAWEASKKAPVKRIVLPILAVGLSGTAIWSNTRRAVDRQSRRKSLTRDAIILGGVVGGLVGGIAFSKTYYAAQLAKGIAKLTRQHFHPESMALNAKARQKLGLPQKEQGIQVHGHACARHDHGHGEASVLKTALGNRIGDLYKTTAHDHGPGGFVTLESIAAGGILGGGLSGVLADHLNHEPVRETAAMKLKEGIFQFVGNITFCTVAILVMGAMAKKLGALLAKNGAIRNWGEQRTFKALKKLAHSKDDDIRRLPASVVDKIEKVLIDQPDIKKLPAELTHLASHQGVSRQEIAVFGEALARLSSQPGAKKAIRQEATRFFTKQVKAEMQPLTEATSLSQLQNPQLQADLKTLAAQRIEGQAKIAGIVGGVATGVIGGAWLSNRLNEFLTNRFHLASGHKKVQLFGTHTSGAMAEHLGERGIHWWDAILHVDDWPSALYLAGVHSLESIIQILYGISGYLTGTAGVDYGSPNLTPVNPQLFENHTPIARRISFTL